VIDPALLVAAVEEGQADLERARAELKHRESEMARVRSLHEQTLATDADLNLAQYNLDMAQAGVTSSEVALKRAERNVDYATIRAPISGTVIERNVDVGQTVAASFSAPQLFLIADDLSRMQILASVDESDIGQIREGQTARFTVQAYPDSSFLGAVRQVRMQSSTLENVVNYSVVVDVANPDHRLLPGMTATVDFILGVAKDVLKVPNSALRFRATPEMVAEMQKRREEEVASLPDSTRARYAERREARLASGGGERSASGPDTSQGSRNGSRKANVPLSIRRRLGRLAAARVHTGITDGRFTEVDGKDLHEGLQVISGVTRASAATASSSNPLQPQPQGPPRGPGGF
jgi:HlyD family secretion protein